MTVATVLEHPGAHRGPGPDWASMRRVLVVRPDNVGDVLMCAPALRALARVTPAEIDMLVSPAGAAAAALLPHVAGTVVASVSWQQLPSGGASGASGGACDPDPDAGLVADLAARGYDAAVVLTSFSQSPWPAAVVCRRAGIGVRIGTSKEFGGELLTHWVPAPPDDGHQVDRALDLLARVGVPSAGTALEARVPASATARVDALLDALLDERVDGRADGQVDARAGEPVDGPSGVGIGPIVVVAPGASAPSRRYDPHRLATAGRALAGDGARVVVTGTAREADLVATAADGVPGARALVGELDLAELAALVARADLVVANNSGGAHLADAVGTPTVVLFAGTESVGQYRPRTVPATVLGRATSCTPCRQLTCPFSHECLDVPASEVVDAARELLQAPADGPIPRLIDEDA